MAEEQDAVVATRGERIEPRRPVDRAIGDCLERNAGERTAAVPAIDDVVPAVVCP
jgi:hypothetical protein